MNWKDKAMLELKLDSNRWKPSDVIESHGWKQWIKISKHWDVATQFDHDAIIDFGEQTNPYLMLRNRKDGLNRALYFNHVVNPTRWIPPWGRPPPKY